MVRTQRVGGAAITLLLFVGAAAYYVLVELHRPGPPAQDTYAHFLPNMLHATRGVSDGGKGLLWNPFQSGGQPFIANGETALFYPPHWLFLILDLDSALRAVLIINMVLGAVGMFLFTREIGLGWMAALGGALVFELGDPMSQLTIWSPTKNGAWAWVPWALFFCERLLRAPSRTATAGLAAVVALELLPGFVLITALTYQLIAIRIGWELIARRARIPWRSLLALTAGLVCGPLLAAVQLVPTAELAGQSLRAWTEAADIAQYGHYGSYYLSYTMSVRRPPVPLMVAPLFLGVLALLTAGTRRLALFYLGVGGVYAVLGLGNMTPLFDLYAKLPPGAATIRMPVRLFWISGLCLAVLTALGLEAVARMNDRSRRRWLRLLVVTLVALSLYRVVPGGLRWPEIAALATLIVSVLAASWRPLFSRLAAGIAVAAVALNLVAVPIRFGATLASSLDAFWKHADVFAWLPKPITEQDRVFLMAPAQDLGFMLKTTTVLRMPGFYDYEALLGRRFVEYVAMMRKGTPLGSIMEAYVPAPWMTPGVRRRLIDLAALRYLMAEIEVPPQLGNLTRVPVTEPNIHLYLNQAALPRARFVARVEVVADPSTLLDQLANGSVDLAAVALVEESVPSRSTDAAPANGIGTARFVTNDPEHVVIDVNATQPGFLVLADQYYPGWRATVNGNEQPITRANYLFRLVAVPAGASRVEFRFRPASLALGAAISAITIAVLASVVMRAPRNPGRRTVLRQSSGAT
jgi:hypothetical protein